MFTTYSVAEAALVSDARITTLDVGANNTRDSLFVGGSLVDSIGRELTVPPGQGSPRELFVHRVQTRVASDRPHAVVIGAAGPVDERGVTFTNNGLVIDIDEITRAVHAIAGNIPVLVVNDALCGAAGLLALPKSMLFQFNGLTAEALESDEITVAILGTGLGVARLVRAGKYWVVKPTELGHLWARSTSSARVDQWMSDQYGTSLELEDFASGLGIVNITRALIATTGRGKEVSAVFEAVPNPGKGLFVAQMGTQPHAHPVYAEAMNLFREQVGYGVSAFGMNFSTVVLAGRPVTGNLNFLLEGEAMANAICNRHKLSGLAEGIPAFAVQESTDPLLGEMNLLGAGLIGASALL
jgi:glucokinase